MKHRGHGEHREEIFGDNAAENYLSLNFSVSSVPLCPLYYYS